MLANLHDAIAAVCPIDGVSMGDDGDRSTWRVSFADAATDAQRSAAAAVLASFDPTAPTREMVDAERDRRVAVLTFGGARFQLDRDSQVNIASAFSLASAAGGEAGNLRWLDHETDFAWIAADNTLVPMDAPTVIAFGYAAAAWKSRHITAARALKNRAPIPADYASDVYWPRAD